MNGVDIKQNVDANLSFEAGNITPKQVWRALVKRKYIAIACLVAGLAVGLYLSQRPRVYSAIGMLQVRTGASSKYDVLKGASTSALGTDSDEALQSDVEVLESRSLALAVAKDLNLEKEPALFGSKVLKRPLSLDNQADRTVVVDAVIQATKIQRVPKTQMITISCKTISPQLSSRMVNSMIDNYIKHTFRSRFESTQRASDWLTGQLGDLKAQVESDQSRLIDLQKRLGEIGLDQKASITEETLSNLARASTEATIQRIVNEARYRMLSESDPGLIEGGPPLLSSSNVGGNTLLASLRTTQSQLASDLARLRAQFGPRYPDVLNTQAQLKVTTQAIEREQMRVLNEAKTNFQAAQHNEHMTEQALAAERDSAFAKRSDLANYQLLQQDYASHRELYQGLLSRLREAGITAGLESSEIDAVDLAEPPLRPSDLGPLPKIGLCLVFAFVAACIVIAVVNLLDTTVHDSEQLEALTGLPSLISLPRLQRGKNQARARDVAEGLPAESMLPIITDPNSPFAESIRILVRSLLLAVPAERRIILTTSTLQGEGKSTVSANLAIAFAQTGRKVTLVDCDMRRPSLHRTFRLANSVGLSTLLSGNSGLEESRFSVSQVPNLSIIPSGPTPPLAAELLDSDGMSQLLDRLIQESSFVLLDAPPAGHLADAHILSRLASGTLLIFRDGAADRGMIGRTIRKLTQDGARLIGFVLNGVAFGSNDYYYSYGYKDDYRYSNERN